MARGTNGDEGYLMKTQKKRKIAGPRYNTHPNDEGYRDPSSGPPTTGATSGGPALSKPL